MHEAIKKNLLDIHDKERGIFGYIETITEKGKTIITEYSLETSDENTDPEILIYEIFGENAKILPTANIWTQ